MNSFIKGNLTSKTSLAAMLLMALGGLEQSGLLALVPEEYKGVAISGVGALMLFLRNVTSQSIASKGQAGFANVFMLMLLVALSTVFLGACTVNPETGEKQISEGGKAALREVAAIGVSRYFRENPGSLDKAERIRKVLTELQETEQFTTVAALKAAVQSRIDKLDDPYDREDFTRLNNLLSPLLAESVGAGELTPGAVVEVREWLSYVAAALPRPQP